MQKIGLGALSILLAGSIIAEIVGISTRWQMPLIFAALMLTLQMLGPIVDIRASLTSLVGQLSSPKIETLATPDAFYRSLRHALDLATSTLDLTHIRDNPPGDIGGTHPRGWFEEVVKWLKSEPSRSVRRIIAVRNPAMLAWAIELDHLCATNPQLNLDIRVVDWRIDAPAINMAIIDGKTVYLAITGGSMSRTPGLEISDLTIARYFGDYYNNLWNSSEPLRTYLGRLKEEPHT
jgi:hypothetical protein